MAISTTVTVTCDQCGKVCLSKESSACFQISSLGILGDNRICTGRYFCSLYCLRDWIKKILG